MRVGKYVIEERIGEGGFGEVWRGHLEGELGFRKPVAIKLMREGTVDSTLINEALIGAQIKHTNIVDIFEFTRHEDRYMLVMELIKGISVEDLLAQHPDGIPAEVACAIIRQTADGLAYAHSAVDEDGTSLGLVHRDLKPANLMLNTSGAVKILDFGIALVHRAERQTAPGKFRGTLQYCSPEQIDGASPTPKWDMWALGAIAAEIVLGRPLITTGAPHEMLMSFARVDPDAVASEVADRVPLLGPVVRGCLELDDSKRLDAVAVREHLSGWADQALLTGLAGEGQPQSRATLDRFSVEPSTTLSKHGATRSRPALFMGLALAGALTIAGILMLLPSEPAAGSGGTLRMAVPRPRTSMDLYSLVASMGTRVYPLVVEHPVRIGPEGEVHPGPVERWSSDEQHREWTLHLRPDAWFHDHPCLPDGHPATAADLCWSVQLALENARLDAPVESCTAEDQSALLTLERGFPLFLQELSNIWLVPTELEGCEDIHNLKQPVGTGPFRFTAPADSERLEVERHPLYWDRAADGSHRPRLDAIELSYIQDPLSVLTAIRSGSIDLAVLAERDMLTRAPTLALRDDYASPGLLVAEQSSRNRVTLKGLLAFQKRAAPIDDPMLRRAISLAIDREAIRSVGTNSHFEPGSRFLGATHLGYDPSLPPHRRNPGEARRLIEASSRTGEVTLGAFAGDRALAERWATQLSEVGLPTRVVPLSQASLEASMHRPPVDMALLELNAPTWGIDPLPFLNKLVPATAEVGFVDAHLRSLVEQMGAEGDRRAREELYAEVERELLKTLPFIPVGFLDAASRSEVYLYRDSIRGFADPTTHITLEPVAAPLVDVWLVP